MLNRNLIFILFSILFPKFLFGQQDPQFSQYFFNQLFTNPAVSSSESTPKVLLIQRSQYTGYQSNFDNGGTLNTQLLSFQMPLLKSNSGIGIVVINDQAGLEKNQQLKLSYAKNFKITGGIFSIGASTGFYNKSFDNNFRPREANDPNVPANGFSQLRPDFAIGMNYESKNLFGGLSINHITNPKFDFGATNGKSIINRTVIGILGVNLPVTPKLILKPNILLRTDLKSTIIEGGLLANINSKYWLGANYRSQDAAILLAGINLLKENALHLGLSYDLVTMQKNIKSKSSFEILASYQLGKKGPNSIKTQTKSPIIRTPRYRH